MRVYQSSLVSNPDPMGIFMYICDVVICFDKYHIWNEQWKKKLTNGPRDVVEIVHLLSQFHMDHTPSLGLWTLTRTIEMTGEWERKGCTNSIRKKNRLKGKSKNRFRRLPALHKRTSPINRTRNCWRTACSPTSFIPYIQEDGCPSRTNQVTSFCEDRVGKNSKTHTT